MNATYRMRKKGASRKDVNFVMNMANEYLKRNGFGAGIGENA